MSRECPDYRATQRISRRRALLRAGTAGIAGLDLPTWLGAAEKSGMQRRARHIIFLHQFGGPSHIDTFDMKPDCARRDPGRVQADRDRPAGPDGHRAPAPVRHGDRPVRPGPVGAPHDAEPQLGHLLQPDRPRPAARRHPAPRHPGAVPRLRQHGRAASPGGRSGDPELRVLPPRPSRRQRHAGPARQLPGQGVRPVLHRPGSRTGRASGSPS